MTNQSKCAEHESLVALVYDDCEAAERHRLEGHLLECAACADELNQLRAAHRAMSAWTMPEPSGPIVSRLGSDARPWRLVEPGKQTTRVPDAIRSRRIFSVRWAQAAAAVLVLGATAAIANLEVRYGSDGLVVRTGWKTPITAVSTPAPAAATATGEKPWRPELIALERQLRTEFGARSVVDSTARTVALGSTRPDRSDKDKSERDREAAQLLQRVQTLVEDSERRQQRELALRVAQVVREVEAQRRADLVRIEQGFGRLEGFTGAEALRQREMLNYLVRVSQKQ